jgi:hypothetical protein
VVFALPPAEPSQFRSDIFKQTPQIDTSFFDRAAPRGREAASFRNAEIVNWRYLLDEIRTFEPRLIAAQRLAACLPRRKRVALSFRVRLFGLRQDFFGGKLFIFSRPCPAIPNAGDTEEPLLYL